MARANLACPVSATVTPTPIIARPPAPPTSSYRRGDRANQERTPLAASPQVQSVASPRQTEMSASSSIWAGTLPSARSMNWGRIAPNKMYDFGLVTPTTTPSRSARQPCRGSPVAANASASDLRCRTAW